MENIVCVTRGTDKFSSFKELLTLTNFDATLLKAWEDSKKAKGIFKIVIKSNMMVYVGQAGSDAVVTDKELVEYLVDHIITLGFSDISVTDAQHNVGRLLKNHNVKFVAEHIGYKPHGRYKIVDLTLEAVPYKYLYKTKKGNIRKWKDSVGITWRDADFRISFAKCKTHEHDWMTLAVKNIYGCFPETKKVEKYHMKSEVWIVTSRSIRNFPIQFAFVDAWVSSDGFQGYKIARPKDTKMLFGGSNAVAVDMEIYKRAGLNYKVSRILRLSVEQLYDKVYPQYTVLGDTTTMFKDLCKWENVTKEIVEAINKLEEVYIDWGFINLKTSTTIDYKLFPPKNWWNRVLVWFSGILYKLAVHFRFYRKLYGME